MLKLCLQLKKEPMKKVIKYVGIAALAIASICPSESCAETIVYKLTMYIKVPRVYDNYQSLGYRKMQSPKIVGYVAVDKDLAAQQEDDDEDIGYSEGELVITARDFVNKTHKVERVAICK